MNSSESTLKMPFNYVPNTVDITYTSNISFEAEPTI